MTIERPWTMCFGPCFIEPGETAYLSMRPALPFRGVEFINEGDSDGLIIKQLTVDDRHQPLPRRKHTTPLGAKVELKMDTCHRRLTLTLTIKNKSDSTKKFQGTILGVGTL